MSSLPTFTYSTKASWLGSAYLLGMAAFTPLWGRLTEVMGKRGAMLFALTLFTGELAPVSHPRLTIQSVQRFVELQLR
jgi:MFS family permease